MANTLIRQIKRYTVTLADSLLSQSFGITGVLSTARTILLLDSAVAQTMQNTANYCIRPKLDSTTQITVERLGSLGTVVCGITLIEFADTSGVYIEQVNNVQITSSPQDVSIDGAYSMNKKFFIPNMLWNSSVTVGNIPFKCNITADNNLKIFTHNPTANFRLYGYVVYLPDCLVKHINGSATGTSFDFDVAAYGFDIIKCFTIFSHSVSATATIDKHKWGYFTSNSNFRVGSYTSNSSDFNIQVVYRKNNSVRRFLEDVSPTSYDVIPAAPIDSDHSFVSMLNLANKICCSNTTSNNADNFMFRSEISGTTKIILYKYNLGVNSKVSIELVELGAYSPIGIGSFYKNFYRRSL